MVNTQICLRQGYNCSCEFCLPWITRWESEVNGFTALNAMLDEGKSLLYIFEKLRSEHTDLLLTHSDYIVDEYYKRVHNIQSKKKRRKLDDSSTSSSTSSVTLLNNP